MIPIICDWTICLWRVGLEFYCSMKWYGFWGLDGRVLKWWSTCHDAHHHVNVISNLCDLDSAFNLHWSVLLQAMSAAACFMISGECGPTYTTCVIKLASFSFAAEFLNLCFIILVPSFFFGGLMWSSCVILLFFALSLPSLCGADEGVLWTTGRPGGPAAHLAGIWHLWTVHH